VIYKTDNIAPLKYFQSLEQLGGDEAVPYNLYSYYLQIEKPRSVPNETQWILKSL
jgi:hypothetical protein